MDFILIPNKEIIRRLSNIEKIYKEERKIYLWADGSSVSKKGSLLILVGKEFEGTIECEIYYVGYTTEKDLNEILPLLVKDIFNLNKLNSINIVADNKCLNIFKNMKKNNNRIYSFCFKEFYY